MDEVTGRANVLHMFIDPEGKPFDLDPAKVYEFDASTVQIEITFDRVIIFTWKAKEI
jgi:hypothetical protein